MAEISGFALSQEELLAALAIAGLPAPTGCDDLAERIFGALEADGRVASMAAAERSLLAHGFSKLSTDGSELDGAIAAALGVCARPKQTWVILHQPAGQTQRATHIHAAGEHCLAHVETLGIHQFIVLGGRQDVLETAQQIVSPLASGHVRAVGGALPEATFAALAGAAHEEPLAELQARLGQAGLSAEAAAAFADTIAHLVSITAFAQFNHAVTPELQRAFTIVLGEHAQWLLHLAAPGLLRLRQAPAAAVAQILDDFAHGS
ncbi:MAG: hypothetical protein CVU38_02455 [Chloroflexi bacterium HGW-Chloroflexi-1]|nr:MAG: hypothetical protein CVU38_02455 [Chloroflexi bacterium HGW-Chloroflexi-1]